MSAAKVEPAAEPKQIRRKATAKRETREIPVSQFGRVRTLTSYGMTREQVAELLGLLRTPEELRPPAVLAKTGVLYRELKATEGLVGDALERLANDRALAEEHRRMLSPPRRKGDPIDVPLLITLAHIEEADAGITAWSVMSREERIAALSNAEAFDRLLALPLT